MAPFHSCKVETARAIANRLHMFLHSIAILAALYHRFTTPTKLGRVQWALLTTAELVLGFVWALTQAFRWRPVVRGVGGWESIKDDELPGVDVFVCTADPTKEPVVEVMNSVISSMALDYPPEKLAVYLSDDGGSPLMKVAIREAAVFCKAWLPFCSKYGIKTRCPDAFFSSLGDDERLDWDKQFVADQLIVQSKYEAFKKKMEKESEDESKCSMVHDRDPCVEIVHDNKQSEESEVKMPLLVYVSREKRPGQPHRFKAGALNALLRVSGLLSNGPYLLVLDCDMYCNDPTSARQSMCFHLDPKAAPSLAFVQYPQIFYNTSKNDIYDGQARSAYKTKWQGMDGLRGPVLTGTGYYLKRKALYGKLNNEEKFLMSPQEKEVFGSSTKFMASLGDNVALKEFSKDELLQEASFLATCTYESNTQWGDEASVPYYFTMNLIHVYAMQIAKCGSNYKSV